MAISKGKQTTDDFEKKLYIGVGSSFVLDVNPKADEIEKLRGFKPQQEPEYVKETTIDDKTYPQARIDFIVKPDGKMYYDKDNNPIDTTATVTFFVTKKYYQGKASGKYQIIDKYGRTAWATEDDIKNKRIPVYSNGPADIDADYRPAYIGEAELTAFIKTYLRIDNPRVFNKEMNTFVMRSAEELSFCEARLDHIDDYFKGNVSEIKEALSNRPENKLKLLYGVKTDAEGKQYQNIYSKMFLSNFVKKYDTIEKEINAAKANGSLANVDYEFGELREYTVTPTDFTQPSTATMPETESFGNFGEQTSPWI